MTFKILKSQSFPKSILDVAGLHSYLKWIYSTNIKYLTNERYGAGFYREYKDL